MKIIKVWIEHVSLACRARIKHIIISSARPFADKRTHSWNCNWFSYLFSLNELNWNCKSTIYIFNIELYFAVQSIGRGIQIQIGKLLLKFRVNRRFLNVLDKQFPKWTFFIQFHCTHLSNLVVTKYSKTKGVIIVFFVCEK